MLFEQSTQTAKLWGNRLAVKPSWITRLSDLLDARSERTLGRTQLFEIWRAEFVSQCGHPRRGIDQFRRLINGLKEGLEGIEAEITRLDALILDPASGRYRDPLLCEFPKSEATALSVRS